MSYPPPNPNPVMTDGRSALLDPALECLNLSGSASGTTYQRYQYLSDNIDRAATQKLHADGDGSPLGSDTRMGFEAGSISMSCVFQADKLPSPGHVIRLDVGDGWEYYVVGKPGRARTRNDIKKGSFAVTRLYNPVLLVLLSEAFGNRLLATASAPTAYSLAVGGAALVSILNVRSGGTLVFSLAAAKGYVIPGGFAIDASTGAISWATSVAGSYEIDVIVTETLTGYPTRVGSGRLSITFS